MVGAIVAILLCFLVVWVTSLQRRIAMLEEGINHAMTRLGLQLATCFEEVDSILTVAKLYEVEQVEGLCNMIKQRRQSITTQSCLELVEGQGNLIKEVMMQLVAMTDEAGEFRQCDSYITAIESLQRLERSMRASRLIYNDHVEKLNYMQATFPAKLVVGMLGIKKRECV